MADSSSEPREKQWKTVDSSDSEQSKNSSHSSHNSSDSSSESSHQRKKKEKKQKKKKEKKKERKGKKDKKTKKHKKSKKDKHEKHDSIAVNQNEFGKYGIIRDENFFHKQREFEVYMDEVKGMPGIMGQSKREIMQHFKSYIEDFNTATMPHEKFYNYEKWEMEEYQRSKLADKKRLRESDLPEVFNDEEEVKRARKREKLLAEEKQFQDLRSKMLQDKDLREDMKRQSQLNTELQLAFKRGDTATVQRIERMLAPDVKQTVKHPWA